MALRSSNPSSWGFKTLLLAEFWATFPFSNSTKSCRFCLSLALSRSGSVDHISSIDIAMAVVRPYRFIKVGTSRRFCCVRSQKTLGLRSASFSSTARPRIDTPPLQEKRNLKTQVTKASSKHRFQGKRRFPGGLKNIQGATRAL